MKRKALVEKKIYIDEKITVVELRVFGMLIYRKTATPESVTLIGLKPL